ncbi:alpha/beta fold hydrolase [Rathayibacter sp. VKM Ac-2857]|uniref:alpha/beta fold hydrolase n=1 Tax=Rathayibacter sp. VKM Ac-2857 TaxID=2739020 RepID=UPI001563A097|nr:alpha/beta fold hydrolase [Rathayibacter sp. VKM Ac-2857]NQX14928.1 alpha/beta fold hydrolase [Rathayibacter sp. VKM Ac-2857]
MPENPPVLSTPDLPARPSRPKGFLRRVLSALASAVAVLLGIAGSTIAAAFALTVSLPFAIAVWIVLSLLLVLLLVATVQRLLPRRPRPARRLVRLRTPVVVAVVATAVIGALAGGTVLAPIGGSSVASNPVAPQYWDLSTGSHVAYWKTAAPVPGGSDVPIVYLHGGPGAFVVPTDFDSLPTLAATGHDVYLFDQAGAGYSSDLPLREYTLERSVADIDAVREKTGADRVILFGHSAGGYLAAAYAAAHPEHVEKAVLVAPATYDPSEDGRRAAAEARAESDARVSETSSTGEPAALPLGTQLRLAAGVALLRTVGPDAAGNLLSQEDSKKAMATVTGKDSGLNLFANLLLTDDFEALWESTLSGLGRIHVPALLVRPQYDHIDWRGQHALARAIPGSQTVYIPGADHDPWHAAFERTHAAVSDFLLDREQPVYTGDADPGLEDAADRG